MKKLSILIPLWNQEELIVKALDSIPRRDDIEVLIRDDASMDNSIAVVRQYSKDHPDLCIKVFANKKNKNVSATRNLLLKSIETEYFHCLDNDDYLFPEKYNQVVDMLDGTYDIYYINLETNDGTILVVDPKTDYSPCADTTRFVRTAFAEGLTVPEDKIGNGDWYFNQDLLARNPKCCYTGITAYHYNYPREGSISDLFQKGLL